MSLRTSIKVPPLFIGTRDDVKAPRTVIQYCVQGERLRVSRGKSITTYGLAKGSFRPRILKTQYPY